MIESNWYTLQELTTILGYGKHKLDRLLCRSEFSSVIRGFTHKDKQLIKNKTNTIYKLTNQQLKQLQRY